MLPDLADRFRGLELEQKRVELPPVVQQREPILVLQVSVVEAVVVEVLHQEQSLQTMPLPFFLFPIVLESSGVRLLVRAMKRLHRQRILHMGCCRKTHRSQCAMFRTMIASEQAVVWQRLGVVLRLRVVLVVFCPKR